MLVEVPRRERADREALRARLERDGYLFLRGLLDPAEVLGFRRYYFERTRVADVTVYRA